ncbi:hypothetical protein BBU72A_J0032 (plasmid) [Borreliella burgdorferi 72a]|nr:hypothetical protein BBU72A_J0032 [Borreliella burgdorferi 72a]
MIISSKSLPIFLTFIFRKSLYFISLFNFSLKKFLILFANKCVILYRKYTNDC